MKNLFYSNLTENQINELNILSLAYVGDAVHTLYVRDYVVKTNNLTVNSFNKTAIKFCNANAQAVNFDKIKNELTEDELNIALRARNAKNHNIPKNASLENYKKATAFEALIGYWWLLGKIDRITEILKK